MPDVCARLHPNLRNEGREKGRPASLGVAIWRPGERSEDRPLWDGSVEEFLTIPANQSGRWLIDGGWGGPPGPLAVDWDGAQWHNRGYPPHPEPLQEDTP